MADTASSSSSSNSSSSPALGGLFGSANPIGGAVSAVSGIANTIAGIDDANKRRHFEEQLGALSNQQQAELNNKLLAANSETERLQILSDTLIQYAIAKDANAANTNTVMYIIAGVMAMFVLGGAIYYAVKK